MKLDLKKIDRNLRSKFPPDTYRHLMKPVCQWCDISFDETLAEAENRYFLRGNMCLGCSVKVANMPSNYTEMELNYIFRP